MFDSSAFKSKMASPGRAVWAALNSPTKVMAPMTGASDLAYRILW
jgi:carbon monoxide dehydrogenase subunit G